MHLTIYTDGGSLNNPGKAASAFVVYKDGKFFHKHKEKIGIASNNVAEYTALIKALEYLKKYVSRYTLHVTRIDIISDSQLMVRQVNGLYKVKNADIKPLHTRVKMLEMQIGLPISYTHVLREKNQEADALVKEALS